MLFLSLLEAVMALAPLSSAALTTQFFTPLVVGFTVAVLPGMVSAANTVKLINHCPYDLYAWTVGPANTGYDGEDHQALTVPANSEVHHGMINSEALGGGISLKLRDLPKYEVAPAGILQVEYHLEPSTNSVWYDLSAIDCNLAHGPESPWFCPLIGGGIKVYVPGAEHGKCPPAWCGATGCHNVYTERVSWEGEPTFRCAAGVDVVVEMCTERVGLRTFNGQAEPVHAVDSSLFSKPLEVTRDGTCGARSANSSTCSGYGHGDCCSEYGWCGFSSAHCGQGCQAGFGKCFSSGPAYQPPIQPSYSEPVHSHVESSYAAPTSSHVESTPSYHESASIYSSPSYIKPSNTPEYSPLHSLLSHTVPSYTPPDHIPTHTPGYAPPPVYSPPSHTNQTHTTTYTPLLHPSYTAPPGPPYSPSAQHSPSYTPPPFTTIYATHTVTMMYSHPVTETRFVTVGGSYNVPTLAVYDVPRNT